MDRRPKINGLQIDAGAMWPMADGPQSSLDWLEKHLSEHELKINEGDTILGGTALGLHRVQSGDCITVKINSKIAIQCTISPGVN